MNSLYKSLIDDDRLSEGVKNIITDIKNKLDSEKPEKKPADKRPTRKITELDRQSAKSGHKVLETVDGIDWCVSPSTGKWLKVESPAGLIVDVLCK